MAKGRCAGEVHTDTALGAGGGIATVRRFPRVALHTQRRVGTQLVVTGGAGAAGGLGNVRQVPCRTRATLGRPDVGAGGLREGGFGVHFVTRSEGMEKTLRCL